MRWVLKTIRKQIWNISRVTSFATQADEQMEDKRSHERRQHFFWFESSGLG